MPFDEDLPPIWYPSPEGSEEDEWEDGGEEDSWNPHVDDPVWDHSTEGECEVTSISDIVWLTTDLPSIERSIHVDKSYARVDSYVPENDRWDNLYIPGIPNWAGELPFYHPSPEEGRYPPDWVYGEHPKRFNLSGVSFDRVNKILSFLQFRDWWNYSSLTVLITNLDFSDKDNVVVTTYNHDGTDFEDGFLDSYPTDFGTFRYVYTGSNGDPILVVSDYVGTICVSLNNGQSWGSWITADEHEGDIGNSYLEPSYYYSIAGGAIGSNTIGVVGLWALERSKDNGASFQVVWESSYRPRLLSQSKYYPDAPSGAPDGLLYGLASNEKSGDDAIWVAMCEPRRKNWPEGHPGTPEVLGTQYGIVQRNLSETLEPDEWEEDAIIFVSESFEDNIYEDTWVYPDDWPVIYDRGWEFVSLPIVNGIKYLPGSDTFWTIKFIERISWCTWNTTNFLCFSEDGGETWSNILCDHKNEENWNRMHPFFSPRAWPFSESYDLHIATNYSGFGYVTDIVEHPSNPNIIITVGSHWWRGDYEVEDPAGRGMIQPFNYPATPDEIEEYSQYAPNLYSLGNYKSVYSVSFDRGYSWSNAYPICPYWEVSEDCVWDDQDDDVTHFPRNPATYRAFVVEYLSESGEASGHEPGFNPGEVDGVWTPE